MTDYMAAYHDAVLLIGQVMRKIVEEKNQSEIQAMEFVNANYFRNISFDGKVLKKEEDKSETIWTSDVPHFNASSHVVLIWRRSTESWRSLLLCARPDRLRLSAAITCVFPLMRWSREVLRPAGCSCSQHLCVLGEQKPLRYETHVCPGSFYPRFPQLTLNVSNSEISRATVRSVASRLISGDTMINKWSPVLARKFDIHFFF